MLPTSWLFVPGNRPDRFAKALNSGAEAVIIDLEDAVATDAKGEALAATLAFLAERSATDAAAVAVRMNPITTVQGLTDLAALAGLPQGADYLVVPKAEAAAEISLIGRILADTGSRTRIVALIETARGVAAAADVAGSSPSLVALMFGAADYAADLRRQVATFRPDFARAAIVNAAAAGGIAALDSPWFDVAHGEGHERQCRLAAEAGFHGKAAIHPGQIAAINSCLGVSPEDRELARRYLAAKVDGVATIDGKMVDIAMLRWAERIA